MPIKMSTPQNRQPPSQEDQLEAIQRLLQQQAESNRRAAESESSADMPQSTFSQRPPQAASGGSGRYLLPSDSSSENRDPLDVRVVEQHPSQDAQPVKVLADLTTNAIVESVSHLEEETKVGFLGLILAFQQVYDSIRNLGVTLGTRLTPGGVAQNIAGIRQPQRTSDPARPSTSGEKPYTRQADKYEPYSGQVFHERVADAMSPESIGIRLREAVFDREGIIGGYAHRMFERRDVGKRYADRKLRESEARKQAIEETARKLKNNGKSDEEVDQFRQNQIEVATKQGIITDLSESELRKRGVEINDLRQRASKLVGIMEDRRNRGERPESINRSAEATELRKINAEIGKKDVNEAYLQSEWEEKRKRKRRRQSGSTSPVTPDSTPDDPEIGSEDNPYPWDTRTPEAIKSPAAGNGAPIQTSGSSPTPHSAEESKEEASLANQELIEFFRDIKTNTDSIPPIYNLLNEKFGDKDGESDDTSDDTEPSDSGGGILDTIQDAFTAFAGAGTVRSAANVIGKNIKGLGSIGAGLFGAYDAVSEMQTTNEALAAGEITQDQATVNNASSIGGGVGMAFGTGFGGAVGSVLGPLGTAGGAWLGGKIGNAVGEVGGEIVGTALNWFSGDAEAATPETLSKEKQTISMHGPLDALKPRPFAPIQKMESGLIKPMTPAPPPISNNPVIAVDARSSSTQTTQVNNWGTSNTDPTFLKYGASRYS